MTLAAVGEVVKRRGAFEIEVKYNSLNHKMRYPLTLRSA